MPRVFYHAHLDCFDVPVMFWWTLVVYCYWRSLEGRVGWAVLTGVAWGCALNVKFNAFMLPAVFLIHWLVVRGRDVRTQSKRGGFSAPLAVVSMLTLGLATFILLWPWMWHDAFIAEGGRPGRLAEYLGFHWNHPYYNIEYLGFNWFRPPFPRSYPYGMILFTVPTITVLLCLVGLAARARYLLRDAAALASLLPPIGRARAWRAFARPRPDDDPRGTDVLFFGAGYAILALWWKTNTPIFGGTKHWFTLYPFFALFAGAGFDAAARALEQQVRGRVQPPWLPGAALAGVCLLPPLVVTAHSHPFGLSAYVPFVGGTAGGADLGLNRQFWGYTTGSLVRFFNDEVPPNGTVYIHDTASPSWDMLVHDGRIRPDIRGTTWGISDADFAIVHHELHMNEVDYQIWQAYQSPDTYYVLQHDGVPIVSVYRNPRRRSGGRE
jgi:4-amino-4-deoxy-L-arabinose transferase-like glycosyltransferase